MPHPRPFLDIRYNRYVNTTYDGEGQLIIPGPVQPLLQYKRVLEYLSRFGIR